MNMLIENLSDHLVLIRLNSGETLHVGARSVSSPLLESDVVNNDKVQKLVNLGVVTLKQYDEQKQGAGGSKSDHKIGKKILK